MIAIIDRIKFRYAGSPARREAWRNAGLVGLILACYAIAGTLDYHDELRQQAAAAQEDYARQQAAMLACLNGGSPGYYTVDSAGHRHYIVCQTYTVSDESTGRGSM